MAMAIAFCLSAKLSPPAAAAAALGFSSSFFGSGTVASADGFFASGATIFG